MPIEESSLSEPEITKQTIDDQPPPLTLEVVDGASKRGAAEMVRQSWILILRKTTEEWNHLRGKGNHCSASVIQHPDGFKVGVNHSHAGEVGLPVVTKLTAAIKKKATENLSRPAPDP